MKLGDVLKKERLNKEITPQAMSASLELPVEDYEKIERGESEAEEWGPILAKIAIKLETPTSRLLAESGKSADVVKGQCGALIRGHREARSLDQAQVAEYVGLSQADYETVEAGQSPLETYGRIFLGFAEQIEQPVFNLFYPCGLPFQELDDYP